MGVMFYILLTIEKIKGLNLNELIVFWVFKSKIKIYLLSNSQFDAKKL